MAAYNLVNDVADSESPSLLTGILRGEWSFYGMVISNWFESVESAEVSEAVSTD